MNKIFLSQTVDLKLYVRAILADSVDITTCLPAHITQYPCCFRTGNMKSGAL